MLLWLKLVFQHTANVGEVKGLIMTTDEGQMELKNEEHMTLLRCLVKAQTEL